MKIPRPRLFRRLYEWMMRWAETKRAEWALGGFAFAESSFFPIPPDPLLIALATVKPARWLRYALITTLASVGGGVLGYLIGLGLFETVGVWIVNAYGLEHEFNIVGERYQAGAFIAIFAAAFSPIPYKVFTIAAGVFRVDLLILIVASLLGRGGRFFLVAYISRRFGARYREQIAKYIDLLSLLFIVILVAGFVAIKYLF